MGMNITVMSYCGKMDIGIVTDRDQVPDAWRLIGFLEDALEELKPELTEGSAQARGKRGSSRIESRSSSSAAHSITSGLPRAATPKCSSASSGRPARA